MIGITNVGWKILNLEKFSYGVIINLTIADLA